MVKQIIKVLLWPKINMQRLCLYVWIIQEFTLICKPAHEVACITHELLLYLQWTQWNCLSVVKGVYLVARLKIKAVQWTMSDWSAQKFVCWLWKACYFGIRCSYLVLLNTIPEPRLLFSVAIWLSTYATDINIITEIKGDVKNQP